MDSDSVYFKNLSVSGPVQFKSMLFKGQLCDKMIAYLVNIYQEHSYRHSVRMRMGVSVCVLGGK